MDKKVGTNMVKKVGREGESVLCLDAGVSHELDSHLSQQNFKKI